MKTFKELQASAIRQMLRLLIMSSNEINACCAVSTDGIIVASILGNKTNPDRFGAMSASLLALADRTLEEIDRGNLKQVLIEGENGFALLIRIDSDTVLALSARPTVNLGMIFLEAKKSAQKIAAIILNRELKVQNSA